MSPARLLWRALAALALALLAHAVPAHEMTMAEMELRELAPGEFAWQWTAVERGAQGLAPRWPEGCRAEEGALHCGEHGLRGELSIAGIGERYSAAMVKVYWRDGQDRVYTLTPSHPTVQLYGAADDGRGMGEVASAYGVLGIEHILTGFDHLLFVIGLLFLVGFEQTPGRPQSFGPPRGAGRAQPGRGGGIRRLLWTISAFTLAHSLTLASSALGWLTLRPPPVEATIALSIVLVASEALGQRDTLSRRWPALVAFVFGLVHGLGFAGALQQIGLPQHHLAVALLTFNVGVEVGQLGVVALCWLLYRGMVGIAAAGQRSLQPARTMALYAIGSIAAYWAIERTVALLA
jgi:hypothetical protein